MPVPPSFTVRLDFDTVTPRESSSLIFTTVPDTVKPVTVVVPVTATVSLISSTSSSVGFRVKVPFCDRVPAKS